MEKKLAVKRIEEKAKIEEKEKAKAKARKLVKVEQVAIWRLVKVFPMPALMLVNTLTNILRTALNPPNRQEVESG